MSSKHRGWHVNRKKRVSITQQCFTHKNLYCKPFFEKLSAKTTLAIQTLIYLKLKLLHFSQQRFLSGEQLKELLKHED